DRLFFWIAMDDDVEKGADDGAEKERQNAECRMQNGGAVSGELVLHSAVCILHSPPRPCNAQRRERVHSEAARYPEANGVWWLPRSSKPLFRRGSVEGLVRFRPASATLLRGRIREESHLHR